MHALAQTIETLVVVMAAAAFAHFGVTLKDAPCPRAAPAAIHRIPVSTAPRRLGGDAPCPLARGVHKA